MEFKAGGRILQDEARLGWMMQPRRGNKKRKREAWSIRLIWWMDELANERSISKHFGVPANS